MKLALILLACVACTSCATTRGWYESLVSDPVTVVDRFETGVQTYLATADAIVQEAEPILGAQAVLYESKFATAKLAVTRALEALADTVQAVADVKQESPDFGNAMTAVVDAVANVRAVIQSIQELAASTHAGGFQLPGLDSLDAQQKTLQNHR